MTDTEALKNDLIKAINNAIKTTGNSWVREATKATVRETVPIAIEETLTRLGMDCKEPLNMQKDFAHLRQSRINSEDRINIFWSSIIKWAAPVIISGVLFYFIFYVDSVKKLTQ